ncbi:hypothetical protein [Methylobacterium nigriterrae]|uniref:hypothetical protein n=1 Tax=Methylobacterium nigriterrae TaxID=3127512 RepID=UPI0030141C12
MTHMTSQNIKQSFTTRDATRFYHPAELRDLDWAAAYARRCKASIRLYGKRHGVAWLVRGRTVVSAPALQMLLSGDHAALEHWRRGDVAHPDVRTYYERLNIALPATAATAG